MIKIEFNEAQPMMGQKAMAMFDFDDFEYKYFFSDYSMYSLFWKDSYELRAVLPYIPTQDPMLDREYILTQLGTTKEQDEANQIEWSKLIYKDDFNLSNRDSDKHIQSCK